MSYHKFKKMGEPHAMEAELDLGHVAIVGQKSGMFSQIILQLAVLQNVFQEEMRLVAGQWCT